MTEPIYTYVKGKGWVIQPSGVTAVMRCGTEVRILPRKPEHGELYLRATSWFDESGYPMLEEFKYAIENSYSDYYQLERQRTMNSVNYPDLATCRGLVTVVKIQ